MKVQKEAIPFKIATYTNIVTYIRLLRDHRVLRASLSPSLDSQGGTILGVSIRRHGKPKKNYRTEATVATEVSLAVDQAFDPALEVRFPKIQQVSDTQVRKSYIGQNLLGVHREQSFNRF
jgi:hypothetical protein